MHPDESKYQQKCRLRFLQNTHKFDDLRNVDPEGDIHGLFGVENRPHIWRTIVFGQLLYQTLGRTIARIGTDYCNKDRKCWGRIIQVLWFPALFSLNFFTLSFWHVPLYDNFTQWKIVDVDGYIITNKQTNKQKHVLCSKTVSKSVFSEIDFGLSLKFTMPPCNLTKIWLNALFR